MREFYDIAQAATDEQGLLAKMGSLVIKIKFVAPRRG